MIAELDWQPVHEQVQLDTSPFHVSRFPNGTPALEFHRHDRGYRLRFPDLADFEIVADASAAACWRAPGVTQATAEHLYLNQVVPLMLSRQGETVFHGSAVEAGGLAIAFLAEAGRGKSTLAASFARNGHRFLTDDGLRIRPTGRGHEIVPGHPSIRLWSDSEQNVLASATSSAEPVQFTPKGRYLAGSLLPYCSQARPLAAAYFLGDRSAETITIRPVPASEALMLLLNHAFILDVQDMSLVRSHFDKTVVIANDLRCFHLDYPRRYDELPGLHRALLDHLHAMSAPT